MDREECMRGVEQPQISDGVSEEDIMEPRELFMFCFNING